MPKQTRMGEVYKRRKLPSQMTWNYVPTKTQRLFHANDARFRLYGGAMGGGKSFALCAEAIKQCIIYPGNRGYLCRNKFEDFRRSTLVSLNAVMEDEFVRKHLPSQKWIKFWNGSEILYGGLGGEEDIERIKSTEFGFFGIDEASETLEDQFLLLMSRLRWILPDGRKPGYTGFLASNPEPGWVKERFVDQKREDHAFIRALPTDNPHLPEGYYNTLEKEFSEEWVKRYLKGSWDIFEGQIYREFDRDKHVVEHIEISPYWERFRVIDHGYRNPTCCLWFAVDYEGRLHLYQEHYERNLTIAENAAIIKEREPTFEGITLIDPSCFSSTQHSGGRISSVADEYREHGIVTLSPYDADGYMTEGVGINLVKQRLKDKTLSIHASCTNTISEMVKYRWRSLKTVRQQSQHIPETPVDKDNHAMDCLRYGCCWKPPGSTPPKPPVNTNTLHYWIQKHKRDRLRERLARAF